MSKVLRNVLFGAIIFLAVAVTLIVFLLIPFEKNIANYIGIGFFVFAEIVLFVGIANALAANPRPNNVFIRSGIVTTSVFYLIVTLILSLVSGLFEEMVAPYIAIESATFALLAIILIVVVLFSAKINASDAKIVSDRQLMQACEGRLYALVSQSQNKSFETQLSRVYENVKYCDKIGASSVDEQIVGVISKLEKEIATENRYGNNRFAKNADEGADGAPNMDANHVAVETILDELSALISQRNAEMAEAKRGGF
ncbi:MAG: hypothetical protein FWG40_06990 [Peptococcaceae bacterium]|nr:hypothetical protein [Peptococcaceae bacterium]